MPRWLTSLLLLLIFFAWIAPNPAQAGATTGNAVESMVTFFRSVGNQVTIADGTASSTSTTTGSGGGRVTTVPAGGGIGTGDGTLGADAGVSTAGDARTAAVAIAVLLVAAALVLLLRRAVPNRWRRLAAVVLSVVLASGTSSVAWADESPAALNASVPVSLRIPAIGVDTWLVKLGLNADQTMEVPQLSELAGWYRFAPTPGQRGPAVITGHVDWLHEPGVFHDLGRLRPGDEVTVRRIDDTVARFRVDRVAQFPKSSFPTGEVFGDRQRPELRLITCGGQFDRITRSYRDNVVVFASMVGPA